MINRHNELLRDGYTHVFCSRVAIASGSADFLGLNHYTTRLCSHVTDDARDPHTEGGFFDVMEDVMPEWER